MKKAMRDLNSANVAIYPVDARGVVNPMFSAKSPEALRGATHMMMDIAEQTGGRAIFSGNDIRVGIQRALADTRASYEVAFYPSRETSDGKYHRIEVNVRRPGTQLLHRRGYFAYAQEASAANNRGAALRDAAHSPLDATGLGVTARVPNRGAKPGEALDLKLELDPTELQTKDEGGQRWLELEVLCAFYDVFGQTVGGDQPLHSVRMRVANQQPTSATPVSISLPTPMHAGAREMRVVVRDTTSGALGSLTVPLEPAH